MTNSITFTLLVSYWTLLTGVQQGFVGNRVGPINFQNVSETTVDKGLELPGDALRDFAGLTSIQTLLTFEYFEFGLSSELI